MPARARRAAAAGHGRRHDGSPPISYEDVMVAAFLPPEKRNTEMMRKLRHLVWDAAPGSLERLAVVTAGELRRIEQAVLHDGVLRQATVSSMRYLAPALFGRHGGLGEDTGAGAATPSKAAAAPSSGSAATRPSSLYRAECPVRPPRAVAAQYGDPSTWQLAGRGASKEVYFAQAQQPVKSLDGSWRRGLVAISVCVATERSRVELCNLRWARDHMSKFARAASRVALPLDMWEMDVHLCDLTNAAPTALPREAVNADDEASGAEEDAPDAVPQRFIYVVFPAGMSLMRLIQRGVPSCWQSGHFSRLAFEMLNPLAALATQHALHRDVKPENTLLLPPRPETSSRALVLAHHDAPVSEGASTNMVVLLADWSTLRVRDDLEYEGADSSDLPQLGTLGYQHFAIFTSQYLGRPWHDKRWDPSTSRSRDVFAVGMTILVTALGQYLSEVQPQPSPAVLEYVMRYVPDSAYVSGPEARQIAAKEVASQWLHLHSFDELLAAKVFEGVPHHIVQEIKWICETSTVRATLYARLGPRLCDVTLQMLSGSVTAAEALSHDAFEPLREEADEAFVNDDAQDANADSAADADEFARRRRYAALVLEALQAMGITLDLKRLRGGVEDVTGAPLPDSLHEFFTSAVVELCGVCARLPMAGLAVRTLTPIARRTGLDQLGCRALELTGITLEEVTARTQPRMQPVVH